jgi:protocatechuate 3,4-dioxygenase beta subunit
MTDKEGIAEFVTIYPGWYVGRDTHIHLKVQTQGSETKETYRSGHVCHTGQLFFPDDLSDAVARLSPYSGHKAERTRQEEDDIFTSQHGSEFLLALKQTNTRSMAEGFTATAVLGVDPNAEPAPVGFGGVPPSRRPQGSGVR